MSKPTTTGSIQTSLPRKLSTSSVHSPTSAPYDVFIRNALELLVKESRKNPPLREASKKALVALGTAPPHPTTSKESISSPEHVPPTPETLEAIFVAFQIACQSRSTAIASIAIDCLGKLFTYNYWGTNSDPVLAQYEHGVRISEDTDLEDNITKKPNSATTSKVAEDAGKPRTYIDRVIDLICDGSLQEGSDEKLQLQIIKALSAACSSTNPSSTLHTSSLLRAIRTAYNIFLLARDANTQIVAQAALSQIISGVFARVNRHPIIDIIPEEPPQPASGRNSVVNSAQASRDDVRTSSMVGRDTENGAAVNTSLGGGAVEEPRDGGGAEISSGSEEDNVQGDATNEVPSPTSEQPAIERDNDVKRAMDSPVANTPSATVPTLSINGDADTQTTTTDQGTPTSADQSTLSAGSTGSGDAQSVLSSATAVNKALPELRNSLAFDSRPPSPMPSHIAAGARDSVRGTNSVDSFQTTITDEDPRRRGSPEPKRAIRRAESYDDLLVKDAFLVFRALCKLSMKGVPGTDGLTRNAASPIPQVFDISLEIFAKLVVGLRQQLKKELAVLFTELILPILESRQSVTFHQRLSLLRALLRIFNDTQEGAAVLVEIYLNYDCDPEASGRENVWERMVNALSKVVSWTAIEALQQQQQQLDKAPGNSTLALQNFGVKAGFAPAITTATLTTLTKDQTREMFSIGGDYTELRKRTLEILVRGILAGLVSWCGTRGGFALSDKDRKDKDKERSSLDQDRRTAPGKDADEDIGGGGLGLMSTPPTPAAIVDDPAQFENLKHRKQILQEGIRKFNFKPKKVWFETVK
ncbi:guanine nucleotide exchange protein for ADP-robosylation factor [Gonapodya sp. JEL0774]|nr:guanine nucleotide exchange protein for ADP-robosylation factor [Gonapodya sp. JEL0774]